ncbi:DUF6428 family protein [Mucilaginibacter yixingensis]|nr:DUF6428 family protein [Mucilaginibacter yixingensis]
METLTWGNFKARLEANPELHLQFQYEEGKLADTSFHITEIKLAPITSVDCGGVMNKWTEVIVQLWEPGEKQAERSMKVNKALSIIAVVEQMLPLDGDAIVKIEFGNSQFDTRQMFPADITVAGDTLTVNLTPDFVQCKAQTRGGSCGTNDKGEECCAPVEKPTIKLVNLVTQTDACCTPGGGCC